MPNLFIYTEPRRQPVAAVVHLRAEHVEDAADVEGEEVASQQQVRHEEWHDVLNAELERVGVDGGEGDRRVELVVDLVDVAVERADVEQAVGVVEDRFL